VKTLAGTTKNVFDEVRIQAGKPLPSSVMHATKVRELASAGLEAGEGRSVSGVRSWCIVCAVASWAYCTIRVQESSVDIGRSVPGLGASHPVMLRRSSHIAPWDDQASGLCSAQAHCPWWTLRPGMLP
jgi:hypothetical protein